MLAGVTRLKNDIRSGNPVTNLVGCHLWLQIFLLDNLDLGIYNKQHGSLPRVKYFDQASVRGMIIMATDMGKPVTSYASAPIRHHSTVCYARSKHSHDDQSASRNTTDHPHEQSLSCGRSTSKTSRMADDSGTSARRMIDELTPTTIRLLGPTDFCNYLRSQYPDLASDETTLLLKEINACCLSHLSTARGQIQLELMKFADKIIDARNRTCTCCAARGFAECPPKLSTAMDEGDITMSTTNTNPWGRGVAPYPPQPEVAELIEQFFMSATHSELARNYLIHEEPRFIRITEIDIRDQLASKKEISHELMSLLLCRYAQLDDKAENLPPYLCWRHQIEPDFLTLMLSDSDFLHTLSIEKQLSADFLKHDIHPPKCFSHPSHVLKAGWF
ncbi:hypothetical protein ZWY2020_053641 [Hordeum vulgare]|nr:hypothetical protein ZWY2020_053641 [Hordeum vulgare]